ncbi:MAG: serine protease, partial [Planctomycetota bacterium]|nr:serine protease [Planctomycetota bacterium]
MTADDTVDGLEALRSGGTEPQHLDDTKLRQVYPRFCSLQTANGHIGTGFLVGPRRILTAYHVYQQAQGAGGLKFAIFELVDDPGSPRGFFELTSLTLVNDQQVFVVGHPGEFQSTVPQARSLTTTVGHIRDHNSQIHRLAHSADTTPGSSGSAVLTVDLQLVGLHHHGEPGAGQNNHAIPIWSILEHLIGTKEDCRFSLVQLSKQSSRKLRVAMDLKTDARIDSIPESLRTYVPAASLEDSSAGLEPLATENVAIDTTVSIQSETVRPGSFP